MSGGHPATGRPSAAVQPHRLAPPSLTPDLLVRPRLVARLAERWEHRAVLLVAGAGFGKSTLLAQALEDNGRAPRGRDHWLSCDAGDAVASTLASGLAAALGLEAAAGGDPARALIAGLRVAPVGTCLVLDDVHLVPEGSEGFELLVTVVRELPAQCHLVLSCRRLPDLPLTRWRAQGALLELGEDDLRFTDAELGALARGAGVAADVVDRSSGWPALASLAARSAGRYAERYIWEEVLADAPASLRRQLAVTDAVGGGDVELLSAVCGEPVDVDALTGFPLVRLLADGTVSVHRLWSEALAGVLDPDERTRVLRRAGQVLAGRGEHDRALERLAAAQDWDGFCDVVCDAAWAGYLGPPADVLARWWALLPPEQRDRPEAWLLESSMLRADNPFDRHATELAARARAGFAERGIVGAEVAATAELTYLLRSQGDYDAIAALLPHLFELDAAGAAAATGFACVARAMIAEQLDDDESLLAELDRIPPGAFPAEWQALVEWLRANSLLMLGRPDEALAAARRSSEIAGPRYLGGRYAVVLARWWCRVDAAVVADLPLIDDEPVATAVDRLMAGALAGTLHAFAGRLDEAAASVATGRAAAPGARPALLGSLALAEAALHVACGDEQGGQRAFEAFLREHPADEPSARRAMRRFPGLAYVLAPEARPVLDATTWGPALEGAIGAGRALVARRAGERPPDPALDPQAVLHGLPLVWASELAARQADDDLASAASLTVALVEAYGPPVREALRALDATSAGDGARRLLAAVPVTPAVPPEVRLLGPVDLLVDGRSTGAPELRRSRVRHLLALLALRSPLPREVVASTLWPDASERSAAANLRTNLSHLQRALEPDRRAGEAPFLLRADGDLLVLAGPPWLTRDLDSFDDRVAGAERALAAGDHHRALDLLEEALASCVGEPLVDVRLEEWAAPVADQLRRAVVGAAVRASELAHSLGRHDVAIDAARRALELEPWSEAAHRALVAAHLASGDRDAARQALDEGLAALAELGVEPEPETAMLARRVGRRFAPG